MSLLSFRSRRHSFVNEENALFLCTRNITHVNREKSSTTARLIVLEKPIKSMYRSCSGLEVKMIFFDLKDIFVCFPC